MSALQLPLPDNLRVPDGSRAKLVTSDVYNICERVKEIDPNLWVYALDPPVHFAGRTYNWSISEMCVDGVLRLVLRFESLDARIIERLQRMLHIPFELRLAEAEKEEDRYAKEFKEKQLDELAENVGLPMLRQLDHDGFVQRRTSYSKRGMRFK